MRIGITADLHFGIDPWVDRHVARFIDQTVGPARLDLLVVAGDVAESVGLAPDRVGSRHEALLSRLRAACACPIAFCAGNHDLWTLEPELDSRAIYERRLAEVAARSGTTYLDSRNLIVNDLAVVGCYGHFDHSLRVPALRLHGEPVTVEHYRRQTPPGYSEPVWMDGRHIRWAWDDAAACEWICSRGRERMEQALADTRHVLFVSHGVPRNEVNGHCGGKDPVSLFLNAFSGTARLEEIVRLAVSRGAEVLSVSGHTHKAVARTRIAEAEYLNVGGTYGAPRLEVVQFPGVSAARAESPAAGAEPGPAPRDASGETTK